MSDYSGPSLAIYGGLNHPLYMIFLNVGGLAGRARLACAQAFSQQFVARLFFSWPFTRGCRPVSCTLWSPLGLTGGAPHDVFNRRSVEAVFTRNATAETSSSIMRCAGTCANVQSSSCISPRAPHVLGFS